MTVLNDELHVAEWLKSRIDTNTSLTAFADLIPADQELPAVRFQVQGRHDVRGVGTHRIITTLQWLVVVTNEGHGLASLVPLADAVDQALQEQSGATSSIRVLSCVRLEPFSLLESEDTGMYYRHAGGLYQTQSQPV